MIADFNQIRVDLACNNPIVLYNNICVGDTDIQNIKYYLFSFYFNFFFFFPYFYVN